MMTGGPTTIAAMTYFRNFKTDHYVYNDSSFSHSLLSLNVRIYGLWVAEPLTRCLFILKLYIRCVEITLGTHFYSFLTSSEEKQYVGHFACLVLCVDEYTDACREDPLGPLCLDLSFLSSA